jgi:hypothetical protein
VYVYVFRGGDIPDGVVCAETDPWRDWAVLLGFPGQFGLNPE